MLDSNAFDTRPAVAPKRRLNPLPENPEAQPNERAVGMGRFPSWLHRKLPKGGGLAQTSQVVKGNRLHTVCEEAKCPNLTECWSAKTATFLAMGKACTRACGFCDIDFAKEPPPLDPNEPQHIADSVRELGLRHVVITQVARDDMDDGGAAHMREIIQTIRKENPGVTVEVLTSDFFGNREAWDLIIDARPEIFNYNLETVEELTPKVRHKATYQRTLQFLKYVKSQNSEIYVKSGLMVGLGETPEQVHRALDDLHAAGIDIVTIGQYLQPNRHKLRVKEFVTPEQFQAYTDYGNKIGIQYMHCGPFIRSSYNAEKLMNSIRSQS